MGVNAILPDLNRDLEHLGGEVVYLNDLDPIKDHELVKRLTISIFDGASFSLIPSCSCGMTSLASNPELEVGDRCPYCHTELNLQSSQELKPIVWIRAPDEGGKLLSIYFLDILMDAFKAGTTRSGNTGHLIRYLLDPYYNDYTDHAGIAYLEQNKIERGLTFFTEHLDLVMSVILNPSVFRISESKCAQLHEFYETYHDVCTPYAVPLLHKSFNIIERAQLGSYVDFKAFNPYMNVINTITTMNNLGRRLTKQRKESIMANVLIELKDYISAKFASDYNKKTGEFRKHVYGSRIPWTSRMVVTSIHGVHDAEEMHYSWPAAIPLFEVHLTNLFMKKGLKPNEIKRRILHAVNNYDPEIHEMINYIIESSPHRTRLSGKPGFMEIENRNPSLRMGSMKSLLITKVKTDPTDITTAISVLILGSSNTDFDGVVLCGRNYKFAHKHRL